MIWKVLEPGMFGNMFALMEGDDIIFRGYAEAYHMDGRMIETRYSELKDCREENGCTVLTYTNGTGLVLTEYLYYMDGQPVAKCTLSDESGAEVESNKLVPLIANANIRDDSIPMWRDLLFGKQLLIPFDNDNWFRYEAVPLRPGRTSYDFTVYFDEYTREGILLGALDFDTWKNGIVNSHTDTRTLRCVSGIADLGSHDVCPHGSLIGKSVESARFLVLHGNDYRDLLEYYGDVISGERAPLTWDEGVPFGFNAFAGLARKMSNETFEKVYDFLSKELEPKGFKNDAGLIYHNLDGGWQRLDENERLALKDRIHEDGNKAGIYDGPFGCRPFGPKGFDSELPGFPGHTYNEVLLRDEMGRPLPPVDGLYAMDVTHPLWFEYTRRKFENFKKWGYDYLKIDFLTHGCMEGVRYDKSIRTGRQAITQAYKFIADLIDEKNFGRPFFLSISISPLFPYGFCHARRFCCDSFGTNDYIEYVLNTQTYAWWENKRLYAFNDPDHIVLHQSFNVQRVIEEGEARARYTTGAISGAMMLLSDDYTLPEAQERALKFATNPEVNKVVRSREAFRPVEFNGVSASPAYTAKIDGEQYVAVFSWFPFKKTIEVCPVRAGIERGVYRDLWTGKTFDCTEGKIVWEAEKCDALLLKLEK